MTTSGNRVSLRKDNVFIQNNLIAIGDGGESAPLSSRKWIPNQNTNLEASYVAIYPPKCEMSSLTEGDYPTAVVIESLSTAQAMSLSFDTLWERL